MTKTKLLVQLSVSLIVTLSMFIQNNLFAQNYYYFGDAHLGTSISTTDQYGSVFATTRKARKTQHIYTGAQLQATGMTAGLIEGIAFYCTSLPGSGYTFNNVEVKFGQTTANGSTSYSGTNISNFSGAGLTTVYSGNLLVNATGWVQITFNQPVMWDGSSNLQVQVCSANTNSSGNGGMAYEAGFTQTRGRHTSSYSTSWCNQTFSYNNAFLADMRFQKQGYNNDAKIQSLNSPLSGACDVDTNINVTIENSGLINLNDVEVHYEINGVAQPVVTLTGLGLSPNADTTLTVANYNFLSGDSIKIWTALPNGVPDSLAANDTARTIAFNSLNGIYTIDPLGNGDYLNFTDAAAALMNRGACGEVIFEANSGIYSDQVSLTSYPVSGDSSIVTFRSATGNAADVVIDIPVGTTNYVWNLNGVSDVNFKDITFKRNGLSWLNNVVTFTNDNKHVAFEGMVFETDSLPYTNNTASLVYFTPGANHNDTISFTKCTFLNGSRAIETNTLATGTTKNLVVDSCIMVGQHIDGVKIYYYEDLTFTNNSISASNQTTQIGGYGADLRNGSGTISLHNNYINGKYPFRYGFWLFNNTGKVEMYNNKIVLGDTSTTPQQYLGVYDNGRELDFFNNSILLVNDNASSYCVQSSGYFAKRFYNNIFETRKDGRALFAYSGNLDAFDFNSVTSSNATPIYMNNQPHLYSAFKNLGYQTNDYSVSHPFSNDSSLMVCNDTLNNVGMFLPNVTADIKGIARGLNPDLGAQEFHSLNDFNFNDLVLCANDTINFSFPAIDSILWNGTVNSTNHAITAAGTYTIGVNYSCGLLTDTFNVHAQTLSGLTDVIGICDLGSSTTLNPNVPNATYSWSNGASSSSLQVSSIGTYHVTISDTNGCIEHDSISVIIAPKVTLNDTFICSGNSVPLNAGITGSYVWNDGTTSQVLLANSSGTYTVTVTDASGCVSTDEAYVDLVNVPVVDFDFDRNYFIVAFNNNTTDGTSYVWDFGDGTTSTEEHPVHIYPTTTESMFYTVSLTVTNPCGSETFDSEVFVTSDFISNVEEITSENINIYPNPASAQVQVSLPTTTQQAFLNIINNQGVIVAETSMSESNQATIDVSHLAKGMYTLQFISTNKTITKQLIIAK